MNKKVLCIHYSQSGQLTEMVENFTNQLTNCEIEYHKIEPKNDFPFPWTTDVFFDTMPETVMEIPVELKPIDYKYDQYDLIILGYQPWFLSPSLPASSILKDETFKTKLANTPIITIIGSRNMWLNSQESVKKLIADAKGKLVGNIAMVDRANNLIGVITILHWMLTGQKTRKWGIFPIPGISKEDIKSLSKFGDITNNFLQAGNLKELQPAIIQEGGVNVDTSILFIESKAKRIFKIWVSIINKKSKQGKRTFWVNAFKYYLLFVLFIVSPILLTLYYILIFPFTQSKLKRIKQYFQQVELYKENGFKD